MNRLSQFWQELKRRKVVRVITVYAAAAFVILELVDIITEPFGLPDWTLKLVVVLLSIGLVISTILSWVYDLTPDGIEKTQANQKGKEDRGKLASNGWQIASYISFLVIVGLIVLNIIPRSSRSEAKEILDKSIAVLPFTYLSDEPDKQYLADGTMDEIVLNLSKIEDLRVLSKTSVEQYRETQKTVTQICDELEVSYLLEGSFQKTGDQVRLIVQLIEPGREDHAWARKFDRQWSDIFKVQSEVAQLVARELQAVITPEEKQLIETIPTGNLTAYDFYQRGKDEAEPERAEELFNMALEYDSSFAKAHVGLAQLYWQKHYSSEFFSEDFMDSALSMINTALYYDPMLSEAYVFRGIYFQQTGNTEEAVKDLDKAIRFNPNDWKPYNQKAYLYGFDDSRKVLENAHKAESLHRGSDLPVILGTLFRAYHNAGFPEKAKVYIQRIFKLDGDSLAHYIYLAILEQDYGRYETALGYLKKAFELDSSKIHLLDGIGQVYSRLGQHEESLSYFKRYIEIIENESVLSLWVMHRIGYEFWINGFKEKAENYFLQQVEYSTNEIRLGRQRSELYFTYYDLAGVYAMLGEREKAFENLRIFDQKQIMHLWNVNLMKEDPLVDSLRDEPEFQKILKNCEKKYLAEHERVRQWLEENDML